MISSSQKLLQSVTKCVLLQPQNQNSLMNLSVLSVAFFHTGSPTYKFRHGGFYKKDFNVLRERPVGPHKKLPPSVKYDGRTGPQENYRYKIHFPKDGKYTINKLPVTKLGGRDPVTGRKVIQGVGGGSKQKHRWIDWLRLPNDWSRDGPDLVEKVISINYDPMRKPMIALTGYGDRLRWQIATSEMKEGDLITTSCRIPNIPVNPVPGNSYPLGALPLSTKICLLQRFPNSSEVMFFSENSYGIVQKKIGDRVIVETLGKRQYSFDQTCQCVVGQVSIHPLKALDIGSPQRLRWLGHRMRSGLWHRKTGIHGRKIRALPPVAKIEPPEKTGNKQIVLTVDSEGTRGRLTQSKKPFPVDTW